MSLINTQKYQDLFKFNDGVEFIKIDHGQYIDSFNFVANKANTTQFGLKN